MMIIHTFVISFSIHFQKTKKTLFAGDWEDDVEVCVCVHKQFNRGRGRSVVQHRRDIFSVICSRINVCSLSRSLLCLCERNAALQGKIQGNLGDFDAQNYVFPSESCNSVSKGTFREFRPFFRPRKFSPRVPPAPLREPLEGVLVCRKRLISWTFFSVCTFVCG